MKIAIGIQYLGTSFCGWQTQPELLSVQESLEQAISKLAGGSVRVVGAGRTDAGVHAVGQVAHFEASVTRSPHTWVRGTNAYLPKDISLQWAQEVPEEFHARFSATHRRYLYVIYNSPYRSALLAPFTTWIFQPLTIEWMQEAATYLLGEHDFQSFRGSDCQAKTSIRQIKDIQVFQKSDLIYVDITANAFLHHMVRNIVGVLLWIGEGKRPVSWMREVLESKDRSTAGSMAGPQGLYLHSISYGDRFHFPPSQEVGTVLASDKIVDVDHSSCLRN